MSLSKKPNILTIKGVFKSNFKDVDLNMLREKYEIMDVDEKTTYDKKPEIFISDKKDNWPKSSNLDCWICSDTCDKIVVAVPIKIEYTENNAVKMNMIGVFDSWECGAYYIQWFLNNKQLYKQYYKKFYKYLTGIKLNFDIVACDPPWDKINYGGTLSSFEWHRNQTKKNDELLEYYLITQSSRCVKYTGNPEERKQDLEYEEMLDNKHQ